MKIIAIIRSKGTFTDENTKASRDYDNYVFYTTDGAQLYQNETLLAGIGKPNIIKVKKEQLEEVYKEDVKLLLGKDVRFLTENGKLAEIKIK